MQKHQRKGLIISVLFVVAIAVVGNNLGRVIWILLVSFLVVAFAFYALRIALSNGRSNDSKNRN